MEVVPQQQPPQMDKKEEVMDEKCEPMMPSTSGHRLSDVEEKIQIDSTAVKEPSPDRKKIKIDDEPEVKEPQIINLVKIRKYFSVFFLKHIF